MFEFNFKNIAAIVFGFIMGWVLLNSFTIVSAGTTKVQTTFGTVNPTYLGEGFHIVNPFSSLDTMDTRNLTYEANELNIPTQDRFNSMANITVKYRINDARTPWIKQNYGTADEFVYKTIRQDLRSIIRDEGRKVKDSRGLAQSDIVTNMQVSAQKRLQEAMEDKGVEIQEVLVQDIVFDSRIANQILQTQDRIQREESEASQLRIKKTQADQAIETARGAAESNKLNAAALAFAKQTDAQAKAEAVRLEADASRYKQEQEALGNKALQASLTPEILKLRELEVRKVEAGTGWNGTVPTNLTVMGDKQPMFLKQMQ